MFGEELVATVKEIIKRSISANTIRGYIGWSSCNNICVDIEDAIEQGQEALQAGDQITALQIACYLMVTGVKLASNADSSSGMLTVAVEDALSLVESCSGEIAKSDNIEIKETAFAIILRESKKKAFDGWSHWRYDFLRKCICLTDKKKAKKLEIYLNELLVKSKDYVYNGYEVKEDKVLRYQLHRHLDGKSVAREELYENIDIDEMCHIAVNDALEENDFVEAERLCKLKVSDDSQNYRASDPNDWNNVLYDIYTTAGYKDKQINQANKLMLFGNTKYWGELKNLYQEEGIWSNQYSELLEEASQCHNRYSYYEILKEENELQLLMNEIKKHPDDIFSYGNVLVKTYPEEVYQLCVQKIESDCAVARDRREYKKVCKLIVQLVKWGGKNSAKNVIAELQEKYPRRSALQDELGKIENKHFAHSK